MISINMVNGVNGKARRNGRGKGKINCVNEIWKRYNVTGSVDLRNRLVENYMDIVKYNAVRVNMRVPGEVTEDELVSAGVFGLMDAIKSYESSRGARFETYCAQRVRGAMLDWLREIDFVPRVVRSRSHIIDRSKNKLELTNGDPPSEDEIEKELWKKHGYKNGRTIAKDGRVIKVESLSNKVSEKDDGSPILCLDLLKDGNAISPETKTAKEFLSEYIVRGLDSRERFILILYYYEGMTMKEVGKVLNLSESGVSNSHKKILKCLRNRMGSYEQAMQEFDLSN
jgi:RNA polymerase sigma factor FliA